MYITELRASDAITNNQRLILTRWIAGVSLIVSTIFSATVLDLSLRVVPLCALGVVILLYNTVLRNLGSISDEVEGATESAYKRMALQIGLDWISLTIFLYLTGGITSPALIFFYIHIIIVAILFTPRVTYAYAAAVVLAVASVALLELAQILPHQQVIPELPPTLYEEERFVFIQLAIFGFAVGTTTLLVESIMQPLQQREQQLVGLFETSRAVLSSIELPDVLNALARQACLSLGARGTTIRLLDLGGKRLDLVAEHGEGYFTQPSIPVVDGGVHHSAIFSGELDVSPSTMPDFPQELIEKQTPHVFLVPIKNTRPLGLLSIYFKEPVNATSQMRRFARALADQGANAIENALAHDALQKAEKQRTQFVHVLTHELRSPVVGSQSLLRALLGSKKATFTDQQRDILSRLSKRMDALLSLINDLLAIASGRARDLQEPLQSIALKPLLEEIVDQHRVTAEEKRHDLQLNLPDEAVVVLATQTGIQRIVDNLLGNAIKYTPEQGQVCVGLDADGTMHIKDTGIGIPEDSLAELGTEFFRASNAKSSDIVGTGLGLATVKQLIDHFGGDMQVASTVGEGTTFTVKLPLSTTAAH